MVQAADVAGDAAETAPTVDGGTARTQAVVSTVVDDTADAGRLPKVVVMHAGAVGRDIGAIVSPTMSWGILP